MTSRPARSARAVGARRKSRRRVTRVLLIICAKQRLRSASAVLTTRMALRPGCSWVVLMVKPVSRRSRKRARAPGDAPGIAAPRGRRHDASIQISSRGDAHNYFHDSIRSLNPFSPRSWVPWYRSSPSASSTGSDAVASAPLSPRRHPAQSRSPPWARSRCRRHRIQPPHPARARKRIHRQSGSPFIFPFRNCETPGPLRAGCAGWCFRSSLTSHTDRNPAHEIPV